jgi:hypothetical protein
MNDGEELVKAFEVIDVSRVELESIGERDSSDHEVCYSPAVRPTDLLRGGNNLGVGACSGCVKGQGKERGFDLLEAKLPPCRFNWISGEERTHCELRQGDGADPRLVR